jgi:hypothetical protein
MAYNTQSQIETITRSLECGESGNWFRYFRGAVIARFKHKNFVFMPEALQPVAGGCSEA